MKIKSLSRHRRLRAGSALVAALITITITLTLVGFALTRATAGSRTVQHSSRWSQAGHAAEAGVEAALTSGIANTWVADGWSGAPGAVGSAPITRTIDLSSSVPGVGTIIASLSVDKVTMGSAAWLRIRSVGTAELSGSSSVGFDARDVNLRKLSLKKDRFTGASVTNPRVSRTIEVLGAPSANYPFGRLFVTKQVFDVKTLTTTQSYDSSDAVKSSFSAANAFNGRTYGTYDATKAQGHGDIATIGSGSWNINHAHVNGNVLYPTGASTTQTENVNGLMIPGFTFTYPEEVAPTWTTTTATYAAVPGGGLTLPAGSSSSSPTRYKISTVGTGQLIRLTNPPGVTESWVEVWVPGDFITSATANSGLLADKGVHTKVHIGGKADIMGNTFGGGGGTAYGISNGSKLPEMMEIHFYGTNQTVNIFGMDFYAICSGPGAYTSVGGTRVYGCFLTDHFDAQDTAQFYYDEALKNYSYGAGNTGYAVKSFIEGVR